MTNTITGNTSYRKSYALQSLIKTHSPNTRAFDNCFEMGDGDEVVRHIIAYANAPLDGLEAAQEKMNTTGVGFKSPEWKLLTRANNQKKLINNLKKAGTWESWNHFVQP